MRIINKLLKISAIALLASPFTGCKEEELVKPSALMAESSVTFEAKSADAQSFRIASDSEWMIDVDEPWITVDPMSGSNTMDVNVTVEDNYTNGVMNAPRQGVITIANKRGYSITTVVYQKGDNYLGVSEVPISDVLELEDGKFAKINGAQVVALTDEGYVVSDASGLLYVKRGADAADVAKLGDKLFLAGEKVSLYGNAALVAGEITVQSNEEVTRPAPLPLLSNLDAEKAKKIMYVSVEAGLLGRDLKFEQTLPVSVTLLDPKSGDVDLDKVNMHNVAINAYFIGLDGDNVKLAATSVDDKGENESLMAFFYDDFSWMKAYIPAEVKVGDSIKENNASAEAPNVRSNGSLSNLLDAFLAKGYEDLNPSSKTLYAQAYYWKMGKTSKATANNNNGLRLPPMELKGSELINVYIEFDWAAHMTGSGDIDKVQVVAELEGKGSFDNGTNVSDPFVTTQEKGHIEWQHAKVLAKGVNNQTRIVLRPAEYSSVTPDQQRWHVDNIKVSDSHIPYAEPEYANVTVSDEVVTFEGTPTGPASITISSDKDWTITKGQNSDWFSIDVTQGAAGSDTKVAVTCEPSTISTLRRSTFVIASADTRKTIHVVQSAAGGELDPLISIVGGNSVTVAATAATMSVRIQANVPFSYDCDVDWITPAAQNSSLVTITEGAFTVAANNGTDERTAHIRFYNDKYGLETIFTVKQLSDHATLPVKWTLRSSCNFTSTWPFANTPGVSTTEGENGYMNSTTGVGTIWFNNANGVANDTNKKCKLDVSDKSPRVMGVWIGDYCQFKVPGKVDKGRKVRISFETRVSGTHPKYWRLQYLDGETWKDACETKTAAVEGEGDVVYTHQMASDGSTNIQVDATVTYGATTDNVIFRFICQTAMQANGKGCLKAPNGGSWRLSVTNAADDDKWQPTIQYAD